MMLEVTTWEVAAIGPGVRARVELTLCDDCAAAIPEIANHQATVIKSKHWGTCDNDTQHTPPRFNVMGRILGCAQTARDLAARLTALSLDGAKVNAAGVRAAQETCREIELMLETCIAALDREGS